MNNLIKDEVKRRKITRLIHFTPTINLLNIFETGSILSRQRLKKMSLDMPKLYLDDYIEINDKLRLDKLRDYVNTSIQHTNHYLLEIFQNKIDFSSWCVIAISAEMLSLETTLYSVGNAASNQSKEYGIGGTIDNFQALFQNNVNIGNPRNKRVLSRSNRLPSSYPTDIQAEALIHGTIPMSKILAIYFESHEEMIRSKSAISTLGINDFPLFKVESSLFRQRPC